MALGTTTTSTQTGTNPSISLTTQDSNNWVVGGFAGNARNTITAGTGTLRGQLSNGGGTRPGQVAFTDNTAASPSAVVNSLTEATSEGWGIAALELRSTSGPSFTKLQILAPGMTAAPGTGQGYTGSPTAQTQGTAFTVTVNAVDANWNLVNTVTDTVGITSSDGSATLPANAALVAGTQTFSVTLNTIGSFTVTASDITNGSKTPNTTPAITVNCASPGDVNYVAANAQNAQVTVYWPSATVLVLEKAGSAVTDTPTNGTTYSVGNTIGTSTVKFAGTGTSVTPTGTHTNGTIYYYKVFQQNGSNCYSPGIAVSASPVASPNWGYSTTASSLAAPGLDPNDVVVAGSNDNNIHFIKNANGTLDWAPLGYPAPINGQPVIVPSASSRIAKNVAYVTRQGSGRVIAVDTGTGSQLWTTNALGGTGTVTAGAAVWLQAFGSLAICGATTDAVFVGNNVSGGGFNSTLYALNGSNSTVVSNGSGNCVANGTNVGPGGILWSYVGDGTTKFLDSIMSAPYVDYTNSAVWVTSHSGGATTHPSLWMFDPTNGQLKSGTSTWNLGDIDSAPTPNLYDGSYVYVGTNAGQLYAVNVSTRSLIGPYTPTTGSGAVVGLPWPLSFSAVSASTPDQIIFTQSTYAQSVCFTGAAFSTSCSGAPSWTKQLTGTPTLSAPVDDGAGHLYIGGSDGKAHELDTATGTDHTSTNPSIAGSPTVGAPAFDVNLSRIYVGGSDGHIYSFTTPW